MDIVKMTLCDIPRVAELELLSFSHPWNENDIKDSFENPCNHFFVAKEDEDIVGYIGVSIIVDEGYILNVAVKPDYRGKGIGKSLMSYLIDFTKKSLSFLTLEVRPSNTVALKLYSDFGFEKVGERKNYYSNPTENALLLTKYYNSKKE